MARKKSILDKSPEDRAFDRFKAAEAEHEEEDARNHELMLKYEAQPDNKAVRKRFRASLDKLDVTVKKMFNAYDAWDRTRKYTVHVPQADIEQITYDGLMANTDALDSHLFHRDHALSGLEKGRVMRALASDLYAALKESRTRVFEEDIGPAPYCTDCG